MFHTIGVTALADAGVIAWWGAGLSTTLALVTLYDRFVKKPIPAVSYSFSGSEEHGNVVMLANPGPTPIMVEHWKLFWAKPEGIRLRETFLVALPDQEHLTTLTIPPYGWFPLTFREQDHFGWGEPMLKHGHLFIEVHIVGRRRPLSLHVYPTDLKRRGIRDLLPHALRPSPHLATKDDADGVS